MDSDNINHCSSYNERSLLLVFIMLRDHSNQELDLSSMLPIEGHAFEGAFSLSDLIEGYRRMGLQGSCLYRSIEILRTVREKRLPVYLGITSNIGTCGLRESVAFLTRHEHVAAIAATAGAIEEDVMKTMGDFKLGEYKNDDVALFKAKINRTGNILVPSKIYAKLHLFLNNLNQSLWNSFWKLGEAVTDTEYIRQIGKWMDDFNIPRREESFVYLAYKRGISLYCPALMDGAIGDALYNFSAQKKSMGLGNHSTLIDISKSACDLIDKMGNAKKDYGDICLFAIGGSVPKHMICNSAIYAGGAKYCVYVNTSSEAEGSNAGAPVSEAITWGKVHPEAQAVKVEAEASLVIPLIIAAVYKL
jgi:deoxyhypusine synthase